MNKHFFYDKFSLSVWIRNSKRLLMVFFCALLCLSTNAQIINGKVVNAKTLEALPYVHIGVMHHNAGVISDDKGMFKIDLSSIPKEEKIYFSSIGYQSDSISIQSIKSELLKIELQPKIYPLQEVVVKPMKVVETRKLGRYEPTKITTGVSGSAEWGFGGEWGLRIQYEGKKYQLENVNFHTRFNTVDSVLYRINIYTVSENLPGQSLLRNELFTKSYAKDKWISKELLDENLIIEEDIIVTFELIRIWYSKKGENHLFFTHGKGYEKGGVYSRESSFSSWKINERSPIAMYVTGRILE